MAQEKIIDLDDHAEVEAGKSISQLLLNHKNEVIQSWKERLRARLPVVRNMPEPILLDSLPEWLDGVIRSLASPAAPLKLQRISEKAKKHGRQRVDQNFDLNQVLYEYVVLRQTIFDILERTLPLSSRQRDIILDAIQLSQGRAVEEFLQKQPRLRLKFLRLGERKPAVKYLITFLIIVVTTLLQLALWDVIQPMAYFFYYPAIILAALIGEGTLAIVLSLFLTKYFFLPPDHSFEFGSWRDVFRMGIFAVTATMIARLTTNLRFAEKASQAAMSEKEAARRDAQDAADQARAARAESEENVTALKKERYLREEFVFSLSHDLRGPLTAARMAVQLIQQDPASQNSSKFLRQALRGIDRVNKMIEDLLDANRVQGGQKIHLEVIECDLTQVVRDAVEELTNIHGDRFQLICPEKYWGYWSSEGLIRILENLGNNAIKYGSRETPVTISIEAKEHDVALAVHNCGSYISPEYQRNLFQIYTRTPNAQSSGQKGWGIGLTIVKGISEVLGGKVLVDSDQKKGTTFTVILPRDSRPFLQGQN